MAGLSTAVLTLLKVLGVDTPGPGSLTGFCGWRQGHEHMRAATEIASHTEGRRSTDWSRHFASAANINQRSGRASSRKTSAFAVCQKHSTARPGKNWTWDAQLCVKKNRTSNIRTPRFCRSSLCACPRTPHHIDESLFSSLPRYEQDVRACFDRKKGPWRKVPLTTLVHASSEKNVHKTWVGRYLVE